MGAVDLQAPEEWVERGDIQQQVGRPVGSRRQLTIISPANGRSAPTRGRLSRGPAGLCLRLNPAPAGRQQATPGPEGGLVRPLAGAGAIQLEAQRTGSGHAHPVSYRLGGRGPEQPVGRH